MSSKNFNSFKDFQSDQIQTSSCKLFTAHYACSNSDLNLTLVTGTTNGLNFQIINSLIASWGVRLTCFDCKNNTEKGAQHSLYRKTADDHSWHSFHDPCINITDHDLLHPFAASWAADGSHYQHSGTIQDLYLVSSVTETLLRQYSANLLHQRPAEITVCKS